MKEIEKEVNLNGRFESITMMDLRKQPGKVIDMVVLGKTFVLTRGRKEVAVISKLPGVQLTINVGRDGKISHGL